MIPTSITTPSEILNAKVELYNSSSTLIKECTCADFLETFSVSREGDKTKIFGYGICQRLFCKLIDLERELSLEKGYKIKIAFGNQEANEWDYPFPDFFITEVSRDEKTNIITLTAHDKLYNASTFYLEDLSLTAPYILEAVLNACAAVLGVNANYIEEANNADFFAINYPDGANFSGNEDVRTILNYIAELTGNIYFINSSNDLFIKGLEVDGITQLDITKEQYYELSVKPSIVLKSVCSTTELGDNLIPPTDIEEGVTQYIKDNPFLNLREDAATLLESIANAVQGISAAQVDCDWEGNHLLEIGDKISFVTNDGAVINSYLLHDTLTYSGYLNQVTEWEYTQDEAETAANSTTLGDIINQTFAKVDKTNKSIDLVVSSVNGQNQQLTNMQLTLNGINSSVVSVKENVDSVTGEVAVLKESVNTKITPEEVSFYVQKELDKGVDKVVTSEKGYVFDDTGLNISDSDSTIATRVDNKGMTVSNMGNEVLVADNYGVKAENLHATTYLHIGDNSRFEDWLSTDTNEHRTACFWMRR